MAHCTSCFGDADARLENLVFALPTSSTPSAPSGSRTVAIIGGGTSGVAAAIEAVAQGARVVLLEKQKTLAGHSLYRMEGLNAVGSVAQRELGVQDSSSLFQKDMKTTSEFPSILARHSLMAVVLLGELGVSMPLLSLAPGNSVARTLRPAELRTSIGDTVMSAMRQYLEARSDAAEIVFGATVEQLLMEGGSVRGVKCKMAEGEVRELKADVVVLATGGWTANSNLFTKHLSSFSSLPPSIAAQGQGDGIILATRDAGAALTDMDRMNPTIGVLDQRDTKLATVPLTEEIRTSGAFFVTELGQRFVNETSSSSHVVQAMRAQEKTFIIMNETAVKNVQRGALAVYQARGLLLKFASATHVAEAFHFPANWAANIATEFVQAKNNGKDKFGRSLMPSFSPDETLYVMILTPSLGKTLGGLKVNKDCQVIGTNESPIGGLFAVGGVVGGVHGSEILAGNSLLASLVLPRVAIRAALGTSRLGRLTSFGPIDQSAAITELSKALGPKMSRKIPDLVSRSCDASYHLHQLPLAVVFAENTKDVSVTLSICNRHSLPVTAWGLGSSLEGHSIPVIGGILISLERMKQIITIHEGDMQVTVQPGIRQRELNTLLAPKGIFFPVDPGSNPTLGGMVANGSSGTTTVGYGTMRDNVRSLEAVLADGSVIVTSSRARKSSAGYDLTHLLIGSEGTLAIVTSITLKVYKIPSAIGAAVAAFPSVDMAARTVIATLQRGVAVHRIELLNTLAIDAVNKKFGTSFPLHPTLFLEFHGSNQDTVMQSSAAFRQAAKEFQLLDMRETTDEKEREQMWRARHGAYFASSALRPSAKMLITDICVPLSRFAEAIVETQRDFEASKPPLLAPIVGHAGDGNFHVMVPFDVTSAAEVAALHDLNERLVRRALSLGGTCTGEHGVGLGKRHWLEEEHGVHAVMMMRRIKKAIDTKNILNPGKVIEVDVPNAKL